MTVCAPTGSRTLHDAVVLSVDVVEPVAIWEIDGGCGGAVDGDLQLGTEARDGLDVHAKAERLSRVEAEAWGVLQIGVRATVEEGREAGLGDAELGEVVGGEWGAAP